MRLFALNSRGLSQSEGLSPNSAPYDLQGMINRHKKYIRDFMLKCKVAAGYSETFNPILRDVDRGAGEKEASECAARS